MVNFLLRFFYKDFFKSVQYKDLNGLKLCLSLRSVPKMFRNRLFSLLKSYCVEQDFSLGLWFLVFVYFEEVVVEDSEMEFLVEKIPSLSEEEFLVIKRVLLVDFMTRSYYHPVSFYKVSNPKIVDLSNVLLLRLQKTLKEDEKICFVYQGTPWLTSDGEFYKLFWENQKDLACSLSTWEEICSENMTYVSQYLLFLKLALTKHPYSVVLQLLDKNQCFLDDVVSNEQISKEKIEDLFPNLNTKGLKRSLFHSEGILYSKQGRTYWGLMTVQTVNSVLSSRPDVNPLWLVCDNYIEMIRQQEKASENVYYLYEVLEKCKLGSDTLKSSIVKMFLSQEIYFLNAFNSVCQEVSGDVFLKMVASNPSWDIEVLYNNLMKYNEERPDLELDQSYMLKHDGKKFSIKDKVYEVVVPKVNKDLIHAGKVLKNCVGDGDYLEHILDGECEIFFVKTNGKLTHCVEVENNYEEEQWQITQATRINNNDMGQVLLRRLCKELSLENAT